MTFHNLCRLQRFSQRFEPIFQVAYISLVIALALNLEAMPVLLTWFLAVVSYIPIYWLVFSDNSLIMRHVKAHTKQFSWWAGHAMKKEDYAYAKEVYASFLKDSPSYHPEEQLMWALAVFKDKPNDQMLLETLHNCSLAYAALGIIPRKHVVLFFIHILQCITINYKEGYTTIIEGLDNVGGDIKIKLIRGEPLEEKI